MVLGWNTFNICIPYLYFDLLIGQKLIFYFYFVFKLYEFIMTKALSILKFVWSMRCYHCSNKSTYFLLNSALHNPIILLGLTYIVRNFKFLNFFLVKVKPLYIFFPTCNVAPLIDLWTHSPALGPWRQWSTRPPARPRETFHFHTLACSERKPGPRNQNSINEIITYIII